MSASPKTPASTPAQRQALRRQRLRSDSEHRRLNLWISLTAYLSLRRLARRDAVTLAQALERLIRTAEEEILASLDTDAPDWDEYFLGKPSPKRNAPTEETEMT